MSYSPPYRSGPREWRTFRGIERAAERLGGKVLGFKDAKLEIEWASGIYYYPVSVDSDGGTRIELQLKYDLEP